MVNFIFLIAPFIPPGEYIDNEKYDITYRYNIANIPANRILICEKITRTKNQKTVDNGLMSDSTNPNIRPNIPIAAIPIIQSYAIIQCK